MKKIRQLVLTVIGSAFVLGGLVSCAQSTSSNDTPVAASSTVYAMTQTPGSNWPNLKVGINALSGKTISKATFVYAVDANMLLSATGFGYNLECNGYWIANNAAGLASKANTWTTTTDVASLNWGNVSGTYATAFSSVAAADKGLDFNAWYTGTTASTLYIKQINVTYTDATTEVLTFTTTTANPVHIVASTGTTDVTFASRLWVSDWAGTTDLSSGLTQGVKTVAF